jgi:uncharacterized protein YcgL (UPF0745 family)
MSFAPRDVKVLKSSIKTDTYIFLPLEADYEELPEALRTTFGEPQFVLDLNLTVERQLAQAEARKVLEALEHQGFYLQLPPTLDEIRHGR